METIIKKINVYDYDELSENAKEKAINDEINYFLECTPYENMVGNFKKAVDKAEKMKTPWFTNSYIWEYCQKEILNALNEYKFLKDGTIFIN